MNIRNFFTGQTIANDDDESQGGIKPVGLGRI